MSEFLQILALYYLCDATAVVRPMAGEEIRACFDIYETVKIYFAPFDLGPVGSLERHAQMLDAYLGFVDWQEANAEIVGAMREEAMAEARGLAPAMVH